MGGRGDTRARDPARDAGGAAARFGRGRTRADRARVAAQRPSARHASFLGATAPGGDICVLWLGRLPGAADLCALRAAADRNLLCDAAAAGTRRGARVRVAADAVA